MYHKPMRTTVTLDDEVHEIALIYARARDISLGAALSELVKNGKAASPARERVKIETSPNGLPVFSSRGGPITDEMVKAVLEDDFE